LEKLQKMVEEKNDITLAELKEGLKQSTGLEISVPTVHRWSILTENLVFLDETGMWLNFTRMYGRAKRGRRCHAKGLTITVSRDF